MKDTVVFSPFKGEAGWGMGFDDLVCRPSRCFFLPHPHPDPLKGRERHSCDCHATNAHGTESHPLMMKHAKTKFQWRLTPASSALSLAAVTKGKLKARPSHPRGEAIDWLAALDITSGSSCCFTLTHAQRRTMLLPLALTSAPLPKPGSLSKL